MYHGLQLYKTGLLERLHSGEKVVVAEGYLFNFERRGFLQAGPFVPTVVLDHPELVRQLHEEFVRAGSDVVQALTVKNMFTYVKIILINKTFRLCRLLLICVTFLNKHEV